MSKNILYYTNNVTEDIGDYLSPSLSISGSKHTFIASYYGSGKNSELLKIDSNDLYINQQDFNLINEDIFPFSLKKIHFRAMNGPNGKIDEYFAYFAVSNASSFYSSSGEMSASQYCNLLENAPSETSFSVKNFTEESYSNRLIIGDSFRSFSSDLLSMIELDEKFGPSESDDCYGQSYLNNQYVITITGNDNPSIDPKNCDLKFGSTPISGLSKYWFTGFFPYEENPDQSFTGIVTDFFSSIGSSGNQSGYIFNWKASSWNTQGGCPVINQSSKEYFLPCPECFCGIWKGYYVLSCQGDSLCSWQRLSAEIVSGCSGVPDSWQNSYQELISQPTEGRRCSLELYGSKHYNVFPPTPDLDENILPSTQDICSGCCECSRTKSLMKIHCESNIDCGWILDGDIDIVPCIPTDPANSFYSQSGSQIERGYANLYGPKIYYPSLPVLEVPTDADSILPDIDCEDFCVCKSWAQEYKVSGCDENYENPSCIFISGSPYQERCEDIDENNFNSFVKSSDCVYKLYGSPQDPPYSFTHDLDATLVPSDPSSEDCSKCCYCRKWVSSFTIDNCSDGGYNCEWVLTGQDLVSCENSSQYINSKCEQHIISDEQYPPYSNPPPVDKNSDLPNLDPSYCFDCCSGRCKVLYDKYELDCQDFINCSYTLTETGAKNVLCSDYPFYPRQDVEENGKIVFVYGSVSDPDELNDDVPEINIVPDCSKCSCEQHIAIYNLFCEDSISCSWEISSIISGCSDSGPENTIVPVYSVGGKLTGALSYGAKHFNGAPEQPDYQNYLQQPPCENCDCRIWVDKIDLFCEGRDNCWWETDSSYRNPELYYCDELSNIGYNDSPQENIFWVENNLSCQGLLFGSFIYDNYPSNDDLDYTLVDSNDISYERCSGCCSGCYQWKQGWFLKCYDPRDYFSEDGPSYLKLCEYVKTGEAEYVPYEFPIFEPLNPTFIINDKCNSTLAGYSYGRVTCNPISTPPNDIENLNPSQPSNDFCEECCDSFDRCAQYRSKFYVRCDDAIYPSGCGWARRPTQCEFDTCQNYGFKEDYSIEIDPDEENVVYFYGKKHILEDSKNVWDIPCDANISEISRYHPLSKEECDTKCECKRKYKRWDLGCSNDFSISRKGSCLWIYSGEKIVDCEEYPNGPYERLSSNDTIYEKWTPSYEGGSPNNIWEIADYNHPWNNKESSCDSVCKCYQEIVIAEGRGTSSWSITSSTIIDAKINYPNYPYSNSEVKENDFEYLSSDQCSVKVYGQIYCDEAPPNITPITESDILNIVGSSPSLNCDGSFLRKKEFFIWNLDSETWGPPSGYLYESCDGSTQYPEENQFTEYFDSLYNQCGLQIFGKCSKTDSERIVSPTNSRPDYPSLEDCLNCYQRIRVYDYGPPPDNVQGDCRFSGISKGNVVIKCGDFSNFDFPNPDPFYDNPCSLVTNSAGEPYADVANCKLYVYGPCRRGEYPPDTDANYNPSLAAGNFSCDVCKDLIPTQRKYRSFYWKCTFGNACNEGEWVSMSDIGSQETIIPCDISSLPSQINGFDPPNEDEWHYYSMNNTCYAEIFGACNESSRYDIPDINNTISPDKCPIDILGPSCCDCYQYKRKFKIECEENFDCSWVEDGTCGLIPCSENPENKTFEWISETSGTAFFYGYMFKNSNTPSSTNCDLTASSVNIKKRLTRDFCVNFCDNNQKNWRNIAYYKYRARFNDPDSTCSWFYESRKVVPCDPQDGLDNHKEVIDSECIGVHYGPCEYGSPSPYDFPYYGNFFREAPKSYNLSGYCDFCKGLNPTRLFEKYVFNCFDTENGILGNWEFQSNGFQVCTPGDEDLASAGIIPNWWSFSKDELGRCVASLYGECSEDGNSRPPNFEKNEFNESLGYFVDEIGEAVLSRPPTSDFFSNITECCSGTSGQWVSIFPLECSSANNSEYYSCYYDTNASESIYNTDTGLFEEDFSIKSQYDSENERQIVYFYGSKQYTFAQPPNDATYFNLINKHPTNEDLCRNLCKCKMKYATYELSCNGGLIGPECEWTRLTEDKIGDCFGSAFESYYKESDLIYTFHTKHYYGLTDAQLDAIEPSAPDPETIRSTDEDFCELACQCRQRIDDYIYFCPDENDNSNCEWKKIGTSVVDCSGDFVADEPVNPIVSSGYNGCQYSIIGFRYFNDPNPSPPNPSILPNFDSSDCERCCGLNLLYYRKAEANYDCEQSSWSIKRITSGVCTSETSRYTPNQWYKDSENSRENCDYFIYSECDDPPPLIISSIFPDDPGNCCDSSSYWRRRFNIVCSGEGVEKNPEDPKCKWEGVGYCEKYPSKPNDGWEWIDQTKRVSAYLYGEFIDEYPICNITEDDMQTIYPLSESDCDRAQQEESICTPICLQRKTTVEYCSGIDSIGCGFRTISSIINDCSDYENEYIQNPEDPCEFYLYGPYRYDQSPPFGDGRSIEIPVEEYPPCENCICDDLSVEYAQYKFNCDTNFWEGGVFNTSCESIPIFYPRNEWQYGRPILIGNVEDENCYATYVGNCRETINPGFPPINDISTNCGCGLSGKYTRYFYDCDSLQYSPPVFSIEKCDTSIEENEWKYKNCIAKKRGPCFKAGEENNYPYPAGTPDNPPPECCPSSGGQHHKIYEWNCSYWDLVYENYNTYCNSSNPNEFYENIPDNCSISIWGECYPLSSPPINIIEPQFPAPNDSLCCPKNKYQTLKYYQFGCPPERSPGWYDPFSENIPSRVLVDCSAIERTPNVWGYNRCIASGYGICVEGDFSEGNFPPDPSTRPSSQDYTDNCCVSGECAIYCEYTIYENDQGDLDWRKNCESYTLEQIRSIDNRVFYDPDTLFDKRPTSLNEKVGCIKIARGKDCFCPDTVLPPGSIDEITPCLEPEVSLPSPPSNCEPEASFYNRFIKYELICTGPSGNWVAIDEGIQPSENQDFSTPERIDPVECDTSSRFVTIYGKSEEDQLPPNILRPFPNNWPNYASNPSCRACQPTYTPMSIEFEELNAPTLQSIWYFYKDETFTTSNPVDLIKAYTDRRNYVVRRCYDAGSQECIELPSNCRNNKKISEMIRENENFGFIDIENPRIFNTYIDYKYEDCKRDSVRDGILRIYYQTSWSR